VILQIAATFLFVVIGLAVVRVKVATDILVAVVVVGMVLLYLFIPDLM